jgi:hypothetical protein
MKNRFSFLLLFFTSFWSFGQNIVTNGDFVGGQTGWTTYVADFAGASSIFDFTDIALVLPTSVAGTDTWHIQVNQEFSPSQLSSLTEGNSYTISFQLAGPQGRPVRMFFGENGGGFAAQSLIDVESGNTGAYSANGFDYSVTFVLNNTYPAMKLGFELGLSADLVGIDNVSLIDNGPAGPQPPAQPVGFAALDNIAGNPVGAGQAFLACGPNNVGGDVSYELYYAPTASAPADPLTATEYVFGSTAGENLLEKIRYLIKVMDCKWIFLDHLSIVVSDIHEVGDERKNIDSIMTQLKTLSEETKANIHCIVHLSRPGGGKSHEQGEPVSLSHLRGSHSIAQLANAVIAFERNQQSENVKEQNLMRTRALKNRYAGKLGPMGYLAYDDKTTLLNEVLDVEEYLHTDDDMEF